MRKLLCILMLLGLVTIGVPMTAAALGLDVEAKAGAGIGLGTTDNEDVTGDPRLAADGGIGIDLYLLKVGPVDIGLSTGVDYSYLTFHSKWSNFMSLGSDQTTDSTYNYINLPIALVGSMPLNPSLRLVVRAGAFIGYFLNGSADLTYDPENPGFGLVNGSVDFDSDTTEQWEYGLHFTAGVDWDLGGGLSVAPSVQFDMGLTDTTVNSVAAGDFKDTFWSLALVVGIKYKVL